MIDCKDTLELYKIEESKAKRKQKLQEQGVSDKNIILIDDINRITMRKQKFLNNICYLLSISINSISNLTKDIPEEGIDIITAKSGNSGTLKTVHRKKDKVLSMIEEFKNKDIYFSLFVYMVSSVEDYFTNIMKTILMSDKNRIKCVVQGMNANKTYDVNDIINKKSIDEVLHDLINQRIMSVMYASPRIQQEYFKKALGIEVDENLWKIWFEIKATRDIIVHNSGRINEQYIMKAEDLSRGELGKEIVIDNDYFFSTIGNIKYIIGKISSKSKELLKSNN